MNPADTHHNTAIRVLVVDAIEPLALSLVAALRAAGHHVTTHARQDSDQADVHAHDLSTSLERIEQQFGPFNRIVFACLPARELIEEPADIWRKQAELSLALAELQAAARLLCRQELGQIWVLLPEDGMRHYLDVPAQPVRSRALMAAVKSLAKEVHSLGLRINALQIQTLAEQVAPEAWPPARPWLKAYALRFKPLPCAHVARFILALLTQATLPLSGMVIPIGIGFPENNI